MNKVPVPHAFFGGAALAWCTDQREQFSDQLALEINDENENGEPPEFASNIGDFTVG